MSMNQLIHLSPIIVFLIHFLSAFARPWLSEEIKAIKMFRESMKSDGDQSVRVMMYDALVGKLENELEETTEPIRREQIETNLHELEREKHAVVHGVKEETDKVIKQINRVIKQKSIFAVVATALSVLITNIGFLIILFTGSYIGVVVALITFLGTAVLADYSLNSDKEFSETEGSEKRSKFYAVLSALGAHLPFFLAMFLWM